jgi:hypothetical protein
MRMFGPAGNPHAHNLFEIFAFLQRLRVRFRVQSSSAVVYASLFGTSRFSRITARAISTLGGHPSHSQHAVGQRYVCEPSWSYRTGT